MLESKIQAKILKNLKALDIYAYKNITTNKKGVPDIVCVCDGKAIFLEVKNEKGKPSELQLYNIEQIRKSGGIAEIVRSWTEVQDILRRINDEQK